VHLDLQRKGACALSERLLNAKEMVQWPRVSRTALPDAVTRRQQSAPHSAPAACCVPSPVTNIKCNRPTSCSPMRRATREVKLQPAEAAALAVELRDDKTRTLTSLLLAPRLALPIVTC